MKDLYNKAKNILDRLVRLSILQMSIWPALRRIKSTINKHKKTDQLLIYKYF